MTSEQPLLGWDPTLAERLRDIDPDLLGRRLRAARVAAGLTQTDAGGPGLSTAYVSRIEAGARRPSARALQSLAQQVGVTPADLLRAPEDDPGINEQRLTLDYAELALETGEAAEAESQVRALRDDLPPESPLSERAAFLHGRALEATGPPARRGRRHSRASPSATASTRCAPPSPCAGACARAGSSTGPSTPATRR